MSSSRPRNLAAILLLGSLFFGLNGVFGQAYRNGWMAAARTILTSNDPAIFVLPGSKTPILTKYIGYQRFDNLHMLASVMFANVVDGTAPQLSLYAVQFAGQLVPVFAVMMIEGLRAGNAKNILYYSVLWGVCMQMFSYAATMPIYALIHILTSSVASNNREAIRPRYLAPLDLKVIIPAFGIGYFLLSFLFAYTFSSGVVRQWCGAIWQGFPQYVVLVQVVLVKLFSSSSPPARPTGTRSRRDDYQTLSKVYSFAFNIAAATQLFTIAVLGGVKLFPSLFPQWAIATLTFNNVFNPGPFYGSQPMNSMASAMQTFFLYDQYAGSAAALIWGSFLYLGSRKTDVAWRDRAWLGWEISRWFIVAGAGGALVRLLQRRDAELLLDAEIDERKKTL